uniref:Uncharacterized protein n=1 Tax=Hucho hucho TaxID=62062 RepID=A0A4W5JSJ7_9TELE
MILFQLICFQMVLWLMFGVSYLFLVQDHHKYTGFLVFSMCLSLWLVCSGAFRRRLVIDHKKKEYRYYIHTHLRHRGPLHQIYIRMIAQKSGEVLVLLLLFCQLQHIFIFISQLLECQGRRIATKLNLNYFDYQDTSKRHLVIHSYGTPSRASVMGKKSTMKMTLNVEIDKGHLDLLAIK